MISVETVAERRRDVGGASCDGLNRRHEFARVTRLEYKTRSTEPEGLFHQGNVRMHRKKHDLYGREVLLQYPRRTDPIERRHRNIRDDHVGPLIFGHFN